MARKSDGSPRRGLARSGCLVTVGEVIDALLSADRSLPVYLPDEAGNPHDLEAIATVATTTLSDSGAARTYGVAFLRDVHLDVLLQKPRPSHEPG